jgi:hypothetical protein
MTRGAMPVTAVELFTVSRANPDRLVELAAKHRLPAMFFHRARRPKPSDLSATAPIRPTVTRQVGIYVGRILLTGVLGYAGARANNERSRVCSS